MTTEVHRRGAMDRRVAGSVLATAAAGWGGDRRRRDQWGSRSLESFGLGSRPWTRKPGLIRLARAW